MMTGVDASSGKLGKGKIQGGKVQWGRMAAGAIVGAVSSGLFLFAMDRSRLDLTDPTVALAVAAGLSYALMGIAVAVGAAAPEAGARFLNVQDADELREQRRSLAPSAVSCVLIGLFLLILGCGPALAETFSREALAGAAAASLVGAILVAIVARRRTDEFVRQIGVEASSATLQIALVVLAAWATLAHFGYVAWVGPVALIAGLALLQLCAIFGACAKRGLMNPR